MIKERNEMLENFKTWFTFRDNDFTGEPINHRINFVDEVGNEIMFFINSKTLIWAYRLKGTKKYSYRQHINNIDKKMKKLGIVKKMKKFKFKTDELDDTYVADCLLDCIYEHHYEVAFYMCKSLFIDAYEEIDENQDFKEIIKYIKSMVREDFEVTQYKQRKIIKELNGLDVDEFKKVCLEYFYDVVQDDQKDF